MDRTGSKVVLQRTAHQLESLDGSSDSKQSEAEDHPGVYHLGEFMAGFTRANPEFMQWMEQ